MNEATLVVQYDRMIHKFANKMLCNYESSDVCMDRDDILQIGRMYVLEAIRQYDPKRGAKLTTFVFLKLFTKFANMGRNFKTRNKRGTLNFSSMARETLEEDSAAFEIGGSGGEAQIIAYLDTVSAHERELNAFERTIFSELFFYGFTPDQIAARHPSISVGRIRQTISELTELFNDGGFNEERAERRTGQGWFNGAFVERGEPLAQQTARVGHHRREVDDGCGSTPVRLSLAHKAKNAAASEQLHLSL